LQNFIANSGGIANSGEEEVFFKENGADAIFAPEAASSGRVFGKTERGCNFSGKRAKVSAVDADNDCEVVNAVGLNAVGLNAVWCGRLGVSVALSIFRFKV